MQRRRSAGAAGIPPRPLPQPDAARIRICRSFRHLRGPQGFVRTGAGLGGEPALDAHVAATVLAATVQQVRAVVADVEPSIVGGLVHNGHSGEDPSVGALGEVLELVEEIHTS